MPSATLAQCEGGRGREQIGAGRATTDCGRWWACVCCVARLEGDGDVCVEFGRQGDTQHDWLGGALCSRRSLDGGVRKVSFGQGKSSRW